MIRPHLFSFLRRLVLLSGAAVLTVSCETITSPEHRISQEPVRFEELPASHRELVREGKVKEGMSLDAVYLAWGRPHEVKESSRNGKSLLTWIYFGRESVPIRTVGVGSGYYGRGGYYGRDCWGPTWSVGYDYAYRRYVAAKVEFENDRVVFWERNQRR